MNMSAEATLGIYEALTEVGVKPDKARVVERTFESALHHGQVMTKDDGLQVELRLTEKLNDKTGTLGLKLEGLRAEMHQALRNQLIWIVGTMIAVGLIGPIIATKLH